MGLVFSPYGLTLSSLGNQCCSSKVKNIISKLLLLKFCLVKICLSWNHSLHSQKKNPLKKTCYPDRKIKADIVPVQFRKNYFVIPFNIFLEGWLFQRVGIFPLLFSPCSSTKIAFEEINPHQNKIPFFVTIMDLSEYVVFKLHLCIRLYHCISLFKIPLLSSFLNSICLNFYSMIIPMDFFSYKCKINFSTGN